MFVTKKLLQKVEIHPRTNNIQESAISYLNYVYARKFDYENSLQPLAACNILKVHKLSIVDGMIVPYVDFEALCYKIYPKEVIQTTISSQTQKGIFLQVPFYKGFSFIVPVSFMPENSDSETKLDIQTDQSYVIWYWMFNGERYYFKFNQVVRVRVKDVNYKNKVITGSFMDQGFGPLDWWR